VTEAIAFGAGILLGALGTLIGAGGGFLLVPALIVVEPEWSTQTITAFSLAVVAANASAGALSYWRQMRVDLRTFPFFAAAAIPGSILGAYATRFIPRHVFDIAFGALLLVISAWLIFRPDARSAFKFGTTSRRLTDREGHTYEWRFSLRIGMLASVVVGFVSSLLGIGGGIVHVPFMIAVLGFPEHIATATSHAVLAVTTIVGTIVHIIHGDYRTIWTVTLATAAGALVGAPIGARLSQRVSGAMITRILAIALGSVAIRLILTH
jgi:uncharacterized membrane protein YfcA